MENVTGSEVKTIWKKLYIECQQLFAPCESSRVTQNVEGDDFLWETAENQLLLKSDAAVELGGGNLPAVSGVLYLFENENLTNSVDREQNMVSAVSVGESEENDSYLKGVTLYGADLPDLKGNVPYARVTLIRLKTEFLAEEFKLYNLLRSIEYIRYRVSPQGYMPRISTVQGREQVRVSAKALEQGLNFYKVGRIYEEAYLKHPAVQEAHTIFITLPAFDYKALQGMFARAESGIMSLEHPLNNLKMDCSGCNLKEVCDEVEKLCDGNFT